MGSTKHAKVNSFGYDLFSIPHSDFIFLEKKINHIKNTRRIE